MTQEAIMATRSTSAAGQLKVRDPALARLLAPLDDQEPVSWEQLLPRIQPGRPLDRLGLCLVILDYLRRGPR